MFGVRWEGETKDDSEASSLDNRTEWGGKTRKDKDFESTR